MISITEKFRKGQGKDQLACPRDLPMSDSSLFTINSFRYEHCQRIYGGHIAYPPTDDCKDDSTTWDSVHQQWCTHRRWTILVRIYTCLLHRAWWQGWGGMCFPGRWNVLHRVDEVTPKWGSCKMPGRDFTHRARHWLIKDPPCVQGDSFKE